ncbi:uncharacterized protein LOC111274834 [Durio zibethinus]|uniref:Uncharacterized protein LOC111274834 n=1 Tax=Durio zibethinus TaxID=66656 RepID=A0A6P5WHS5_DURZI|nr:uncharacterized protein LOC111274834 [Durio zibethinus]
MAISELEKKDDNEKSWKMYFDGTINALWHEIGVILISFEVHYYLVTSRLNFNYINIVVEYEACVMGLQAAIDRKIKILKVFGDSALVIFQLKREWETRDLKLIPYHKYITELCKQFEEVQFEHLCHEENYIADALATLMVIFQVDNNTKIQPIKSDVKDKSIHCTNVEKNEYKKPWYYDILQYLKNQQFQIKQQIMMKKS